MRFFVYVKFPALGIRTRKWVHQCLSPVCPIVSGAAHFFLSLL
jgi:hypothetical protein